MSAPFSIKAFFCIINNINNNRFHFLSVFGYGRIHAIVRSMFPDLLAKLSIRYLNLMRLILFFRHGIYRITIIFLYIYFSRTRIVCRFFSRRICRPLFRIDKIFMLCVILRTWFRTLFQKHTDTKITLYTVTLILRSGTVLRTLQN